MCVCVSITAWRVRTFALKWSGERLLDSFTARLSHGNYVYASHSSKFMCDSVTVISIKNFGIWKRRNIDEWHNEPKWMMPHIFYAYSKFSWQFVRFTQLILCYWISHRWHLLQFHFKYVIEITDSFKLHHKIVK